MNHTFPLRPTAMLPTMLTMGALALGLAGCGAAEAGPAMDESHAHHAEQAAPHSGTPSGGSLFVLDHLWTDQTGRTLTLTDLGGRPIVVAMVYTHCTFACPRIIAQLKRIEGTFQDVDASRAPGLVLVSIDPDRDTPGRLAEFATDLRLDPARWTLLTGSDDAVLELSVLLGVKYRATGEGDFAHSNVLTVLDAEGAIVTRVEGLGADLEPALAALRRLVVHESQ